MPPDPISMRAEDPPAGGGAPPPSPDVTDAETLNITPEHQPADSWEEAAVDPDPLITPENEEVPCFFFYYKPPNFIFQFTKN